MTAPRVLTPTPLNERFLKASQVRDAWGLNMLIYGSAGSGKTTLAATAQDSPHGRPVLFIDVEGGVRSIADRADVTVFRPERFAELVEVYAGLQSGAYPFKTVVIDSLTEAQALSLRDVMRTSRTPDLPQLQDYGRNNAELTALVRAFVMLAQKTGINVVFTALSREVKDDFSGAVLTRPALRDKAEEAVTGAVDALAYLTFDAKSGRRVLHLEPTLAFKAKMRQPAGGAHRLPPRLDNPSLVEVLRILRTAHPQAADGKEGRP